MKKLFLILMACLIGMPALHAKPKPFSKGAVYVNFSLADTASGQIPQGKWSTIMTGDIPDGDVVFEKWMAPGEWESLSRLARIFTLEYGLSSNLGLEFQVQTRSGNATFYHVHYFTDPILLEPTSYAWGISGHFSQRIYSVGFNYHLDFIKADRLDVYTGLQVGLEEMEIAFLDKKPELPPEGTPEPLQNAPLRSHTQTHTLFYSQIAVGARYFIFDRLALQARSGLKVAFAGWPTTFFYGAGLTLAL